jgi:hypothetical protein
MSNITVQETLDPIPSGIRQRLSALRGRIRRFLLVDGLSRVLMAVLVIAGIDMVVDFVFRMDVAQRAIVLVLAAVIVFLVFFRRLLRPLTRAVGDDALILQVEGKDKSIGENLISTVQFARERKSLAGQGYSGELVDETIRRGSRLAESIDFNKTLDSGAFARNAILLLACAATLTGIGAAISKPGFLRTWFNRNVLLSGDQWPRDTRLEIAGVSDGRLTLPRGEDHRQIVMVDPKSRVQDVEVTIEFDDGFSRSKQKMRRTGNEAGREHVLVFRDSTNPFRFRALGGDDVTDWVEVGLVDPPAWKRLDMAVQLPEYTGVGREVLPPGGGPYSILEGSTLSISASANKPLGEAWLRCGEMSWPLVTRSDNEFSLTIPGEALVPGKYTFDLVDTTGLRSSRPASFGVTLRPDRPPRVSASLLGISSMVVPRARIPVLWNAEDEYRVSLAEFAWNWSGDGSGQVPVEGALDLSKTGSETAAMIGSNAIRTVDVLDMEPLNIPPGTSFNLWVRATDNNTRNGPGVGESRRFLLRVVTEEELRADLLRREIEQRKVFEAIVRAQEELLVDMRGRIAQLAESGAAPEASVANDLTSWQRRQKLVGTGMASVANRFEEFLVEIRNNRLDEAESELDAGRSMEKRLSGEIIEPIRALDQKDVVEAAQLIEAAGRRSADPRQLAEGLTAAAAKQDEILVAMRKILAAMEDSELYQDVVNLAIEVKKRTEDVRDRTRKQSRPGDSGDIFDDKDEKDLFEEQPEGGDNGEDKDKQAPGQDPAKENSDDGQP